jgi:hypothetical protein
MSSMVYHVDGMGATDQYVAQAIKDVEQAFTTGAANSGQTTPVSGSTFNPEGNVNVQSSQAGQGNSGTGGTQVLFSYTLPANALDQPGRCLSVMAFGLSANNVNAKTVELLFNGTVIASASLTASEVNSWQLQFDLVKTGTAGSNTQVAQSQSIVNGTHLGVGAVNQLTATESGPIVIEVAASAPVAVNDVLCNMFQVNFMN